MTTHRKAQLARILRLLLLALLSQPVAAALASSTLVRDPLTAALIAAAEAAIRQRYRVNRVAPAAAVPPDVPIGTGPS